MIASASSDEERVRIAIDFGIHAFGGYQCFPEIFRYIESMNRKGETEKANFLYPFARMAYQTFIDHHTRREVNGVVVNIRLEDNSIIHTYGQALNEGITHWQALKVVAVMFPDGPPTNNHYLMEVELTNKLVSIFGEDAIVGSSRSGVESYNALVRRIDQHFGRGAFMKIITLSDAGRWREVFQFIAVEHEKGVCDGND